MKFHVVLQFSFPSLRLFLFLPETLHSVRNKNVFLDADSDWILAIEYISDSLYSPRLCIMMYARVETDCSKNKYGEVRK